jgi:single-stranded-DNA-specific exonuclease
MECGVAIGQLAFETRTFPRHRWDVLPYAPREQFSAIADVPPLLVQVLWNRGIRDPADVRAFLAAGEAQLASPHLMKGMTNAVNRLARARDRGEKVAVYGDYDVDGVSSTALLTECLTELGFRVRWFVPRRDREGYGLSSAALDTLAADGVRLVLAVDCGISAAPEVDHARSLGMDVIVADHHHVPATLPNAAAVVNPHQSDCAYPFKELCAVGIAYQLASALGSHFGAAADWSDRWLDLVALGTVADVVPLVGENRTLVIRGLRRLNPPQRPGLRALAQVSELAENRINASAIGYILAPRLNAAGRIDDAATSLRLLLTTKDDEARKLAGELNQQNYERQQRTRLMLDEARRDIRAQCAARSDPTRLPKLLVVAREGFHQGVVGLIAGRLVEEFRRPALVAEEKAGVVRGSARSIEGFHIAEALAQFSQYLHRHGGHALAAGFTMDAERLGDFQRELEAYAEDQIPDEALVPSLLADAEVRLRKHDQSVFAQLAQLEPFGCGNSRPLFVSRGVSVVNHRTVGSVPPGHLQLTVQDGERRWDAMGFGLGDFPFKGVERVDLAFAFERNEWNGQETIRLRLYDVELSAH